MSYIIIIIAHLIFSHIGNAIIFTARSICEIYNGFGTGRWCGAMLVEGSCNACY